MPSWRDRAKPAGAKGSWRDRARAATPEDPNKPSTAEAVVRGGAQGLPFADEAYGAFKAMGHAMYDPLINVGEAIASDKPFGEAYDEAKADDKGVVQNFREARDFARRRDKEAEAAHPGAFHGAELTTGVASAFVPGAGVLNAAKGAKLGTVAAKGAAGGAITGLSQSEADLTKGEVHEALADTGNAALIGGLTAGGLKVAGNKLSPKALRLLAERRATKAAIGNQGKIYNELVAKGDVEKVGGDLLDEGIVRFGSNAESIAGRASAARKRTGEAIGEVLDQADAVKNPAMKPFTGVWAPKQQGRADGKELAAKIRAYATEIDSPNNEALVKRLHRQADRFEKMGRMSLKETHRLKGTYKYKFKENPALGEEATNKIRGFISDEMESAVGKAGQVAEAKAATRPAAAFAEEIATGTGGTVSQRGPKAVLKEAVATDEPVTTLGPHIPEMSRRYDKLKGKYGSFDTAAKGAKQLHSRQSKNRSLSLTDYMIGLGVGGATLNPLKGMAAAAGNKALRERGSAAAAVTLNNMSKVLAAGGEALGPFAPILRDAAKNGHLAATHYALMEQDPSYAELVGKRLKSRGEKK